MKNSRGIREVGKKSKKIGTTKESKQVGQKPPKLSRFRNRQDTFASPSGANMAAIYSERKT